MTRRTIDGLQGACAIVGITIGVIPLVRWVATDRHGGLFEWVFGARGGVSAYLVPLLLIAVAVGAIAALEKAKPRA
ncbi:hypothetical protein [Streptoalloteichus hindustanus]|uniref:Uncharacterized protein n=1 Tax=Streptoalloteichus hindustanus TaxID=2017 RepID=A0A1M5DIY4_STRHI|nr:hypothetical protein [Streptoalloteichus hindustanus]SHF66865.1 hypothetical protein SAMN05444320_104474 [Streptoalloteichus hindustanus]